MSQVMEETVTQGVLELHQKGFGFLRSPQRFYAPQQNDAYVSNEIIRKHKLREGTLLAGTVGPSMKGSGPRLETLSQIENMEVEKFRQPDWDDLTAIDPKEKIRLEFDSTTLTTRVMDMFAPIGKGQRGLIVAPPRTGKTVLLQHIAQAVSTNHPEMHLMVLLVDERPEEVTEMRRNIRGEVVASSSDRDSMSHIRTAELVMQRAKRLTEQGKDVFVLLDSLTRLARAYNKNTNGGRTMSGGLDTRAMEVPKRLFGSARALEEGGSLTVMGTVLVETGSRMDDVIFEEFKGTGNMELILDRKLSDRRIFPAMNLAESGTRKEELLMDPEDFRRVSLMRRHLMDLPPVQAMENLLKHLAKCPNNQAFLDKMKV
jgi:transcription termination factor Rho